MKKSIILILILVACIFAFNHFAQNNRNELSELQAPVQNIKLEYKSERGFGNDKFDIYSFSVEGEINFNNEDSNLEAIYQKEFRLFILIIFKKRCVHKFINLEGTKKLYLYDLVSNKGYCFILII